MRFFFLLILLSNVNYYVLSQESASSEIIFRFDKTKLKEEIFDIEKYTNIHNSQGVDSIIIDKHVLNELNAVAHYNEIVKKLNPSLIIRPSIDEGGLFPDPIIYVIQDSLRFISINTYPDPNLYRRSTFFIFLDTSSTGNYSINGNKDGLHIYYERNGSYSTFVEETYSNGCLLNRNDR